MKRHLNILYEIVHQTRHCMKLRPRVDSDFTKFFYLQINVTTSFIQLDELLHKKIS